MDRNKAKEIRIYDVSLVIDIPYRKTDFTKLLHRYTREVVFDVKCPSNCAQNSRFALTDVDIRINILSSL